MAGDSAAVSEMHRPGLLHRALACPGPPSAHVGNGLPCGHCPGCSMSPLVAVPLGALVPLPCSGLFSAGKSLPTLQPLPGILPSAASRGVSQRLGVPRDSHPREPGQPASSQAPWSSWAAPLLPVPVGVLPPSEGAASWPAWAGRRPARGQVLRVWAGCLLLAAGEGVCGAQSRGLQVWPGKQRHHHPACCRLLATPGYLGSWLRQAPGGREAPLPRRRRSCWNGCVGWTGAASEPAGATSTGSCAA